MKTKQELENIKKEYEILTKKLKELSDDELKQVVGGNHSGIYIGTGSMIHVPTFGQTINDESVEPKKTKPWFGSE